MRVKPDAVNLWTAEQVEKLGNIKFKGPGFYLGNEYTLLVVPNIEIMVPFDVFVWDQDTEFNCHWYGCKLQDTIFAIAIPLQFDGRTPS